ncbi:Gfo/Idh/MocA family protein [Chloroflexota bacterium]
MKSNEPLKVGVVGCGRVTLANWGHIPSLSKVKKAKISAVCDMNENVAKTVAEKFHINRYYTDFSAMLKKEKLDIVDICTQPSTHHALSIEAMEAGCHVLVEKLMAMNSVEADEMIEAAAENNVKLCVVHNKLFKPLIMKARALVSQGDIGDLTGMDLRDAWSVNGEEAMNIPDKDHWYHKLPAGALGEMLPHPIYLAMAFLGSLQPVAVYAKKIGDYEWLAADELRVILDGENGIGTITTSCNWARGEATIDLFGTKRNLHVSVHSGILMKYGYGKENYFWRALDNLGQSYQQLACTASTVANTRLGRLHSGHRVLIERFIESVQNDTRPPVTGKEGKEVVRVLEIIDDRMSVIPQAQPRAL